MITFAKLCIVQLPIANPIVSSLSKCDFRGGEVNGIKSQNVIFVLGDGRLREALLIDLRQWTTYSCWILRVQLGLPG